MSNERFNINLHSSMVIVKQDTLAELCLIFKFTFQYGYSKTKYYPLLPYPKSNLHSSMVIVKQSMVVGFICF